MKNTLKVFLTKNELTPDPNDYNAVVSSTGSVNFDDIIDEMIAEGTEHKRETLVDIARRFQRVSTRLVLNGHNVNTGQIYMRPIVSGVFYGNKWDAEKNSVYVAINQSADLRKAIADTTVEILGEKASLMTIYQVVNLVTKTADGTLAIGRNAQVDGTYIKIAGDAAAVGAYLINTATNTETKLAAEDIVSNSPSKLVLYIPTALQAGSYKLKIITQYTGSNLLKNPREVVFEQDLQLA